MKLAKMIGAFAFTCALFAFSAWCGGYDFDRREPYVGYGVFAVIVIGLYVAANVAEHVNKDTENDNQNLY